jgi:hypothetical protein
MKNQKTKTDPKAKADTLADMLEPMTVAMRLEAASNAEGLTVEDVLRFPELRAKYVLTDATPEDVAEAKRLSRKLFEELVRRHGLNNRMRPSTVVAPVPVPVSTEKKTMASFTINKKDLVGLLVSLGYKLAAKWPEKRLLETVRDKIADHEDGEDCSDPALLKKLIKAVGKGVEIILDTEAPEDEPEAKPAKKGSKAKPAPEPEAEDDESDDDESDDDESDDDESDDDESDDDEPEAKPAKKGSKAKPAPEPEAEDDHEGLPTKPKKNASKAKPGAKKGAKADSEDDEEVVPLKPKKDASKAKPGAKKGASKDSDKKPGVIATIFAIVQKATASKPMSREDVFAALVDAFPERDADALKSTVQTQLPSRISKERNVQIEKNEKGYWIVK